MFIAYSKHPIFKQLSFTSKSVALMLPSMFISAAMSLMISLVCHLVVTNKYDYLLVSWREIWLTSWALLFPITYMLLPLVQKITKTLL
jgi:hypothetical protein